MFRNFILFVQDQGVHIILLLLLMNCQERMMFLKKNLKLLDENGQYLARQLVIIV
jgi:hypothetical protein